MRDPFKIDGPACISFSGGRTSAYMLWRILQAWDGKLPDDVVVCFANTGKEMEETLRFVDRCSKEWGVPIDWIEYDNLTENRFKFVTFEIASRNGEPFAEIIKKRNFLPNPIARFCTVELKILPMKRYCESKGWCDWDVAVGIRSDEPRRVAKISANPSDGKSGINRIMPLAKDVTAQDVGLFWQNHSFDLELPNMNGKTMHGNCDLCFLKGAQQIQTLISEQPNRALWWIEQEHSITNSHIKDGGVFRKDRPSYRQMYEYALAQKDWIGHGVPDETIPCFCGD